jgi:gluconate kinase
VRFADGRSLRPPANVTALAMGDPDPDRLAKAEALRRILPEPDAEDDAETLDFRIP